MQIEPCVKFPNYVYLHHENLSFLIIPACAPSSQVVQVLMFSCAFAIALCRQYGNIGSGRLWKTSAFTLQSNLVKLLHLFAGAVVKTYQTPPWGQERPLPRSSFVEEKIGQLFVSSMRGSLCPDPILVNLILTTVLTV